ncbi:hypothetical protein CQA49_06730 [Helicobacter sp. MIT 00-7814]|uniref:hypothetical protein n=1 Tax=unclassified Helicobacter TaxID=2593540 RepID=UPI000E1F354E|nr:MULTISPECIES: hypothetical protein [unclassified Helicobacter]RDU53338.1 hypothetical protein CQA49_06730 [Helicobacter sp. MIT 00-7814]RDU54159.1 hypothetical protein CQA37_05970 [Helicobacter sp. MIT 99-10781]
MFKIILAFLTLFGFLHAESELKSLTIHKEDIQAQNNTQEQESQKEAFKKIEWQLGFGYSGNFSKFKSDMVNYSNSNTTTLMLKAGLTYRPIQSFGVSAYVGIGMQTSRFDAQRIPISLSNDDLTKLQSMITDPQLIQQIQAAVTSGNLNDFLNLVSWQAFDYNYLKRDYKDITYISYAVPMELNFLYYFKNDLALFLGASYYKGGLIDEGNVFLGVKSYPIEVKIGYNFYLSPHYHDNARMSRQTYPAATLYVGILL